MRFFEDVIIADPAAKISFEGYDNDTYIQETADDTVEIYCATNPRLTIKNVGGITIYTGLYPSTNHSFPLGANGQFFSDVFSDEIYIEDTATSLTLVAGDLTFTDTNSGVVSLASLIAGSVNYGADEEVPFMNGTTAFQYSGNMTFTGSLLTVKGIIRAQTATGVDYVTLTTNTFNMYHNSTQVVLFYPDIGDAGSSVAFAMGTDTNLTASGAKLFELKNATVSKFYVDKDGAAYAGGTLLTGGAGITIGNTDQIPHSNAGTPGDDFDYTSNFTYNATGLGIGTSAAYKLDVLDTAQIPTWFASSHASGALVIIASETGGANDAMLGFRENGSTAYTIGQDGSADQFVIARGSGIGTPIVKVETDGTLLLPGSYLLVGDKTANYVSGFEATMTISKTGTSDNTSIEMGGNQTANTWLTGFSFHNEASSYTDKRVGQMGVERYNSNNASRINFTLWDSSANFQTSYIFSTASHTWYIAGTTELYLDGSLLRPGADNGLALGSATYAFSAGYIKLLYTSSQSLNSKSYKLVTNNGADELVTYETDSSDIRFKNDRRPITYVRRKLLGLSGITFQLNELGYEMTGQSMEGRRASVIAQDLLAVDYPEAVKLIADTGYYDIDDRAVCALLVEGWKGHDTEIDKLKKRIEKLEKTIKELSA